MAAPRKIAAAALLVGSLAVAIIYESRLVARQREQLRTLRARRDALSHQVGEAQQRNIADARALADLQQQIDAARASGATAGASSAELETRAWLAQLAKVRQLFAEHPGAAIPELQLLSLRDWIGTVKGLPLDTEEHVRKSLAAVRDAAKRLFTQLHLASALRKYLNTHDGELPASLPELAPYFNPPIDVTILDRYKMNRTGNVANLVVATRASDPVVLERAAIDEDFDQRHGVNAGRMADGSGWGVVQGSFGGLGPAAWIDDYQDRLKRARTDFNRDHPGAANAGLAQVAPYFNPPLDPTKLQKLLDRERDGKR